MKNIKSGSQVHRSDGDTQECGSCSAPSENSLLHYDCGLGLFYNQGICVVQDHWTVVKPDLLVSHSEL